MLKDLLIYVLAAALACFVIYVLIKFLVQISIFLSQMFFFLFRVTKINKIFGFLFKKVVQESISKLIVSGIGSTGVAILLLYTTTYDSARNEYREAIYNHKVDISEN